jgi:hypothetical protein
MVQCSDGSYAGADAKLLSNHTLNAPMTRHTLKVLAKEGRWEEITFSGHEDFDAMARKFLERLSLRPAFRTGLAEAMRKMAASGQRQSSVDIIDLL